MTNAELMTDAEDIASVLLANCRKVLTTGMHYSYRGS
jgi:hypothetical protein